MSSEKRIQGTAFPIFVGRLSAVAALLVLFPLTGRSAEPVAGAVEAHAQTQAFLESHCIRCHGEKKQKGKFRIDEGPTKLTDPAFAAHWGNVLERLTSGEMPPEDEEQPTPEQRAATMQVLSDWIKESDAAQKATAEKVGLRRLTREEYANTLHDLLGVTYVPTDPGNLPEDTSWHGFNRIGPALMLSPSQLEKYLAAAEVALDQVLPAKSTTEKPFKMRHSAQYHEDGNRRVILPTDRVGEHPPQIQNARAADYKVRVQISGLRPPGGNAPQLRVYCPDLDRVLYEGDVDAPEDKPALIEFTTHLPAGTYGIVVYNITEPRIGNEEHIGESRRTPFHSLKKGRCMTQRKLTDEEGVPILPFLILDYFEVEEVQPPLPPILAGCAGDGPQEAAQAKQIVEGFAGKAFRRPLRQDEVAWVGEVIDKELSYGQSVPVAARSGLVAVLCSKSFLFLVEGDPGAMRLTINDWELASRLSYFFWSTMPDESLLALAKAGRLHEPEVLRGEVQRMLADPRAGRFATTFPYQWLQLSDVGKFAPDNKLYPNYSKTLEKSMVAETTSFFQQMLEKNLGIREFLQSDWTMMNGSLARFYRVPGVVDAPMKRVSLPADGPRGGILTHAAVLSLTSDGTRSRPVHRGKWVLESIFGKTPPPPPPNVKALEASSKDLSKLTIRQKLDAHITDASCATCHSRMDPLGFAFDNFDAIGAWRDVEVTVRAAKDTPEESVPVNASGKLPDGRAYTSPREFKELLAANLDPFALTLAEKLATYGLRRPLTYADRESLRPAIVGLKDKGYPLRDLIEAIVLHPLFQER